MTKHHWLKHVWLAALLVAGAGTARAEMMTLPYSGSVTVTGTALEIVELQVASAGKYQVTATDLNWLGTPLQALSFGVFTSTTPLGTMQGAGSFAFDAQPGKLFLQVYATAGGSRGVGLVGLDVVSIAPVPLPSSIVLLSGVLPIWLFAVRRRARRDTQHGALLPA